MKKFWHSYPISITQDPTGKYAFTVPSAKNKKAMIVGVINTNTIEGITEALKELVISIDKLNKC